MKVWIVTAAYRMDYEIMAVYAAKEMAEADCERRNIELGEQRHNPSWTFGVVQMPVIGCNQEGVARE